MGESATVPECVPAAVQKAELRAALIPLPFATRFCVTLRARIAMPAQENLAGPWSMNNRMKTLQKLGGRACRAKLRQKRIHTILNSSFGGF